MVKGSELIVELVWRHHTMPLCPLRQHLLLHDHRGRLGVALVRLVAHDAVAQAFVVCLQVRQGYTHAKSSWVASRNTIAGVRSTISRIFRACAVVAMNGSTSASVSVGCGRKIKRSTPMAA